MAQDEHLGQAQGAGVADRLLVVHSTLSLSDVVQQLRAKKKQPPENGDCSKIEMEMIRPKLRRFEKQRRKLTHIVPLLLRSLYITRTGREKQDGILHENRP